MTTPLDTLTPLQGHCVIVPEDTRREVELGIVIPDSIRTRMGGIGKVVRINPQDRIAEQMRDQRVVMQAGYGRAVKYQGQRAIIFPVKNILAILPADSEVKAEVSTTAGGAVPRCRFCRSPNGEANVLILNGTCVQCGRNAQGETPKPREQFITPEQADKFDPTAKAIREQPKGQIISYAGQRRRSPT